MVRPFSRQHSLTGIRKSALVAYGNSALQDLACYILILKISQTPLSAFCVFGVFCGRFIIRVIVVILGQKFQMSLAGFGIWDVSAA